MAIFDSIISIIGFYYATFAFFDVVITQFY